MTQFDNSVVESAGMLKMDFLGLKNLTIIKDCCKIIKHIHDVDIDKSTYANGYEKFEAGTPPIAPVIGFSSSLNFMNFL